MPKLAGRVTVLALAASLLVCGAASAAERKRCCFRMNVQSGGGLTADYGNDPQTPLRGSRHLNWRWSGREIVEYTESANGRPTLQRPTLNNTGDTPPGRYHAGWSYFQDYSRRNQDGSRTDLSCSEDGEIGSNVEDSSTPGSDMRWAHAPFGTFAQLARARDTHASEILDPQLAGRTVVLVLDPGPAPSLLSEGCASDGGHDANDLEGLNGPWNLIVPPPSRRQFRRSEEPFRLNYIHMLDRPVEHRCLDRDVAPGCGIQPHITTGTQEAKIRFTWFPRTKLGVNARRLANLRDAE